jgi:hypothetical protein
MGVVAGILLQQLEVLVHLSRHKMCHCDAKVCCAVSTERTVCGSRAVMGARRPCGPAPSRMRVVHRVLPRAPPSAQADNWFIDRARGRVVLGGFGGGTVYCLEREGWPDLPFNRVTDVRVRALNMKSRWGDACSAARFGGTVIAPVWPTTRFRSARLQWGTARMCWSAL